ncbi:MAG: hypothetical protein ABI175_25200 [Polyangiales bacterium]
MITYALLALCAAVFFGTFWLDGARGRARFPRLRQLTLVFQIGALLAAYAVMRPGRGVDGRQAVLDSAKTGRPVMLDLYSNF